MDKKRENQTESVNIVLTIDIGTINTRVSLFECQEGRYHFAGTASGRTVYSDIGEVQYQSVTAAVHKLEQALDRNFLDDHERIIVPQKLNMIGADQVVVTWSGGEQPRIVLMGLTEHNSLEAMRKLLLKNGLRPAAQVCAMEGRALTENIGIITAADPDIVMVAGGTDNAAEKALFRLGEILLLGCKSIDEKSQPSILYMGSSSAKGQFEKVFTPRTQFFCADNILESKGQQIFPTSAFQKALLSFAREHNPALDQLIQQTECTAVSSDFAYGRCIRLLSRINRMGHSVLGVEIGAERTISAFGSNLALDMNVSDTGIGRTLPRLLGNYSIADILPWVSFQLRESELRDYMFNKSLHPDLIPANSYSANIEHALARFLIRKAIAENGQLEQLQNGMLGMVLMGGAVLRNVEDPGDALRIAMDSLRPRGMIDYYLDMNGLASAIGALAGVNRELAAQVTTPAMFLNLGRVITPVSRVKEGQRAFSVSIRDDAGNVRKADIIQGGIKRIPLEYGQPYELDFFNLTEAVSIPGVQTWAPTAFKSGCFGLVFDMRGETLPLPEERSAQIHLMERWKKELGPWKMYEA